ncbi:hypothetical protein EDB81DRAFT_383186 [Dactylonectria macrodidyma]|uniref:Secreted protein n=1 Tax=Dactylonectria macrodidyma TaxID=307937 RepID=A0A9P9F6D6_9HYPO|nr:hypothetical protein EDB81DRAFT_383186 [Dactylonectria macrodidyma]
MKSWVILPIAVIQCLGLSMSGYQGKLPAHHNCIYSVPLLKLAQHTLHASSFLADLAVLLADLTPPTSLKSCLCDPCSFPGAGESHHSSRAVSQVSTAQSARMAGSSHVTEQTCIWVRK